VVPGIAGVAIGLILVALGSGGLKASATAVVRSLYAPDDPRRDAGFSLFYLGINLGAFLGPILTGLLQENAGFHWGFGLAAVGMAAGLIQYTLGRKNLPPHASRVPDPLPRERYPLIIGIAAGTVVLVAIGVLTGLINPGNLALLIIVAIVAAAVSYFVVVISSRHVTDTERSRVFASSRCSSPASRSARSTSSSSRCSLSSDQRLDRFIDGFGIAIGIGALLAVASPWVLKLMRGVR
jgi:POT family proton-dependent oligopeptide transporter